MSDRVCWEVGRETREHLLLGLGCPECFLDLGSGRGRAGSAELVISASPRGSSQATPIKVVALSTDRPQQHAAPLANISNTSEGLPAAELMASVYAQLPASAGSGEGAGAVLPLRLLKPEDAERVAKQAARAARLITSGDSSGLLSEHSTSGELPPQAGGAQLQPAMATAASMGRAASVEFLPVLPPMHVHSHPVTTGQGPTASASPPAPPGPPAP